MRKMDIKDGFWRMVSAESQEWNFAYVLPKHPVEPTEIVVPSDLQMGWFLSPPFFCAASKTSRDVAASYVDDPQGGLPEHPLEDISYIHDWSTRGKVPTHAGVLRGIFHPTDTDRR